MPKIEIFSEIKIKNLIPHPLVKEMGLVDDVKKPSKITKNRTFRRQLI
jgi:hypothetical protein